MFLFALKANAPVILDHSFSIHVPDGGGSAQDRGRHRQARQAPQGMFIQHFQETLFVIVFPMI